MTQFRLPYAVTVRCCGLLCLQYSSNVAWPSHFLFIQSFQGIINDSENKQLTVLKCNVFICRLDIDIVPCKV